jgi:hypothetical protein
VTSAASRLALVAGLVLFALPASAAQLNTGGSGGAYDASFCPAVVGQLKLAQFDYQCTPSSGARENMQRVLADPRQLGYGQLDVFVLEARQLKADTAFVIARQDDVRECVFAVTRNRDIGNYGELAAYADKLRFILPPPGSGSASTRIRTSLPTAMRPRSISSTLTSISSEVMSGISPRFIPVYTLSPTLKGVAFWLPKA